MPAGGKSPVRVDFQNADSAGRVRLNTAATAGDIAGQGIALRDGIALELVDGELRAIGQVAWNETERVWVAVVDWNAVIESGT